MSFFAKKHWVLFWPATIFRLIVLNTMDSRLRGNDEVAKITQDSKMTKGQSLDGNCGSDGRRGNDAK